MRDIDRPLWSLAATELGAAYREGLSPRDVIDATRALEIGLVNKVVEPDQLLPAAIDLAARIAAKSWRAVEATKQALRSSWQVDLATSMNQSFWAVAALHYGPDLSEGVNAFLDKRKPQFNPDAPAAAAPR